MDMKKTLVTKIQRLGRQLVYNVFNDNLDIS